MSPSGLIENCVPVVRYNGFNTEQPVSFSAASTSALVVGPNGTTNPTLSINTNGASAVTGLEITANAAGNGVRLTAISSGTNESITIAPKGTGQLNINGSALVGSSTAMPAGGTTGFGLKLTTTSNFGIFCGSGAPTLSAAQGSLYLRTNGTGAGDRIYVNTNGTTGWAALTSAS